MLPSLKAATRRNFAERAHTKPRRQRLPVILPRRAASCSGTEPERPLRSEPDELSARVDSTMVDRGAYKVVFILEEQQTDRSGTLRISLTATTAPLAGLLSYSLW